MIMVMLYEQKPLAALPNLSLYFNSLFLWRLQNGVIISLVEMKKYD